jgi:hypothetical protein
MAIAVIEAIEVIAAIAAIVRAGIRLPKPPRWWPQCWPIATCRRVTEAASRGFGPGVMPRNEHASH